jgi:hypothetical protein
MGKPIFKASDGDGIDILRVSEDVTESGLQQVSGIQVLIRLEVRPEAFPRQRIFIVKVGMSP